MTKYRQNIDDDFIHTVGMPGMKVKRPNNLYAFLSNATSANEYFKIYADSGNFTGGFEE